MRFYYLRIKPFEVRRNRVPWSGARPAGGRLTHALRRGSSCSRLTIAAAKASTFGASSLPAPSATISRQIFTRSETSTGVPQAIASTTAMPKFSVEDGSTNSAASTKAASLSFPRSMPVKVDRCSSPLSAIQRRAECLHAAIGSGEDEVGIDPGGRHACCRLDQDVQAFFEIEAAEKRRMGRSPISGWARRKAPSSGSEA